MPWEKLAHGKENCQYLRAQTKASSSQKEEEDI